MKDRTRNTVKNSGNRSKNGEEKGIINNCEFRKPGGKGNEKEVHEGIQSVLRKKYIQLKISPAAMEKKKERKEMLGNEEENEERNISIHEEKKKIKEKKHENSQFKVQRKKCLNLNKIFMILLFIILLFSYI